MAHDDRDDEQEEALPQGLREALRSVDRPLPLVTARVDREVAAMAQVHFAGGRRRRVPWPAWAAVAAVAAIAVLVGLEQDRAVETPEVYADVDDSGRIDIADVLELAKSGRHSQAQLDTFARHIVSLDTEGDAS